MKCIAASVLAAVMAGVAGAQEQAEISVKSMPPSAVKTVPQAGDTEVAPALKEISVTFSVSVHGVRRATAGHTNSITEDVKCRQVPDGSSEGGGVPQR